MDKAEKIMVAVCGAVALATGFVVWRRFAAAPAALAPGQMVTPPDTTGSGPGPIQCGATPRWSWHLRDREVLSNAAQREYPAGERLIVLQRGTLTRNGASIYRVRVIRDNAEGWCFLFGFELQGACAGASTEPPNPAGEADARRLPPPGANGPFGGDPTAVPEVPPIAIVRR